MRVRDFGKLFLASACVPALTSCGGGTVGTNFIAPGVATPTPAPTPTPVGALARPPGGVTSTTDFATLGDQLQIRWNAGINAYEVSFPGTAKGRIVQISFGEDGAVGDVVRADGSKAASAFALTPYNYTGLLEIKNAPQFSYVSAYGVPTAAGGVPTTGSASYTATLDGHAGQWLLYGTAALQFDFAAGKLTGFMDPKLTGRWSRPPFPDTPSRRPSFRLEAPPSLAPSTSSDRRLRRSMASSRAPTRRN